jgi:hypothetical protein
VSDVSSQRAPRVEQAHARDRKPRGRRHEDYAFGGVWDGSGSGVVKTLVPSIMQRDSHGLLRGVPDGESRSRESRTYGERVHVIRSGGRSRLDASRVFRTGSSQELVEREGASQEEARSTA